MYIYIYNYIHIIIALDTCCNYFIVIHSVYCKCIFSLPFWFHFWWQRHGHAHELPQWDFGEALSFAPAILRSDFARSSTQRLQPAPFEPQSLSVPVWHRVQERKGHGNANPYEILHGSTQTIKTYQWHINHVHLWNRLERGNHALQPTSKTRSPGILRSCGEKLWICPDIFPQFPKHEENSPANEGKISTNLIWHCCWAHPNWRIWRARIRSRMQQFNFQPYQLGRTWQSRKLTVTNAHNKPLHNFLRHEVKSCQGTACDTCPSASSCMGEPKAAPVSWWMAYESFPWDLIYSALKGKDMALQRHDP